MSRGRTVSGRRAMDPAGGLRFYLTQARRPLAVSAVVGTVLCLINGSYFQPELWRVALNYCVPFCVSFYSRCSLLAECARRREGAEID